MWNACNFVSQFDFKIAHVTGSVNTAADFLSGLKLKLTEKIRPKIQEDVQTTAIEVTTSSSDVVNEEQIFFTQTYVENEIEKQTREQKEQYTKKARQWVANEELSTAKPSLTEFRKIGANTTSLSLHRTKANARIRVERDVDLVLMFLKLKILGQIHDEVLLTMARRFKHYKANEDHIFFKGRL